MALYRCAACGSPNVVMDTQQQGYDYVKGAIGTVVLGAGGAAAGINGKTKKVYKCPDCGLTLNEPMSLEIKTLIDIGVMSPASRKNLQLGGVPIDWEVFTRKYKNIEKDTVSTQANLPEHSTGAVSASSSTSVDNTQPAIPADKKDRNRRIYKVARNNYIKECMEWAEKCKAIKKTRGSLIKEAFEKEKARLTDEIAKNRDTCVATNTDIKERCTKELAATEELLASLGFFKFSAKREAREKIEMLNQKIENATNAISNAKRKYTNDMKNVDDNANKAQSTVLKEIEKKHPMPLKPKKPFVLSKFTKDGEETQAMDVGKFAIQNAIFEYIEEYGSVTYQQIKTGCNAVAGLTDSWIHPLITALLGEYSIKSSGGKYVVNYSENPDWEVRLISDEDMRAYEEYQREEEAKKEKANQEKNAQRNKILEVMKGKGPVTVNDIREYSPEFDTPRTSMIMNQLAEEGVITKTVQSRRSYFDYK